MPLKAPAVVNIFMDVNVRTGLAGISRKIIFDIPIVFFYLVYGQGSTFPLFIYYFLMLYYLLNICILGALMLYLCLCPSFYYLIGYNIDIFNIIYNI